MPDIAHGGVTYIFQDKGISHDCTELSEVEAALLRELPLAKQNDRLQGTLLAKQLVAAKYECLGHRIPLRDIVLARNELGKPFYTLPDSYGDMPRYDISLSHSLKRVGAAVASGDERVGIDTETVRSFPSHLLEQFLTPFELAWVTRREDRALAASLLWSLKEAYIKALGRGLRTHPKTVEVQYNENGMYALKSHPEGGDTQNVHATIVHASATKDFVECVVTIAE